MSSQDESSTQLFYVPGPIGQVLISGMNRHQVSIRIKSRFKLRPQFRRNPIHSLDQNRSVDFAIPEFVPVGKQAEMNFKPGLGPFLIPSGPQKCPEANILGGFSENLLGM
ncbi:MAG: hypothetical protein DWI24_06545 [Planctomycetota bacterium]|nr:MAG: hypothetical protein DWI24_06545 [Planctomycetota bacterium]